MTATPMLKLFSGTEKSPSSHSRSKTVSHFQTPSSDTNTSAPPITTINGFHFNFMTPTSHGLDSLEHDYLTSVSLAKPTNSHQRSHTEQIRAKTDLPPLITQSSQPSLQPGLPRLSSSPQRNEFQFFPQQSRQCSPSRQKGMANSVPLSDSTTQGKPEEKAGKLVDWFRGESAPISVGILPSPTKEKSNSLGTVGSSSEIRPSSLLQRRSTAQGASKSAMASRFSFFSSKASLAKPTTHLPDLDDELLDMNVSKGLFPAGSVDPIPPAALKNLQQQAESLLSRLQTACRERTLQLREMTAEKEALAEETEGAEIRARHLKMQLDDMSVKLAEQDEAMMNLVDELAREKLARREEEEARKRTVRLVEHNSPPNTSHRRISCANTVSDSGFESEDDSPSESVFSRRNGTHSPTMSMSSVSSTNSPDGYQLPDLHIPISVPKAVRLRAPTSQLATKGMSAAYRPDLPEELSQSSCPNCQGVRASEAWSVLGVLKEENQCLKHRVCELEGALDGCLGVVSRLS